MYKISIIVLQIDMVWLITPSSYYQMMQVRVVLSGSYPISELSNVTRRRAWIADRLQQVSQAHADGFNLDIEEPTRQGTDDTQLLTEFVGEFYTAFKKANENYQVNCFFVCCLCLLNCFFACSLPLD